MDVHTDRSLGSEADDVQGKEGTDEVCDSEDMSERDNDVDDSCALPAELGLRSGETRSSGRQGAVAQHCGELLESQRVEEFHYPLAKVHARNAEGRYWKEFESQVSQVFPSLVGEQPESVSEDSWGISCDAALGAAERQSLFFKSVDGFDTGGAFDLPPCRSKTNSFDRALAASFRRLHERFVRSPSVVMEAAFFLLREGLLNIPDVGTVNVKQARAFLWHAAWLQEHMNRHWRAESPLHLDAGEKVKFENFCVAIMGPSGTGKTAVLKLSEALTLFFVGSDTVRKLAPSNAAARLLGGNTLHSLCKLPFGGVRLTRKRGRLTKDALRRHRKTWESTLAAYIDELSMISADQFLQTEVRLRQAKQLHNSFGGLAVIVCGDFLQLPLVDREGTRKSLAMSNYDVPEVSDPDVAEDEVKDLQRKKEKLIESRQGFD